MYNHVFSFSSLQVDVVYVGNIHACHFEAVMMMLDGRKPVICEKPLTVSVKDAAAMIQTAKEKELFLMEVSG